MNLASLWLAASSGLERLCKNQNDQLNDLPFVFLSVSMGLVSQYYVQFCRLLKRDTIYLFFYNLLLVL